MPTINEIIDEQPISRFQKTTVWLCALVLFLDGFDTQSIGFLVPPISEEFGIPLSAFGSVFAAGLLGLMFGTMLGGPIADRWGRKWAIIGSTVLFGVFSIATAAFAETTTEFALLRFLTGLGLGGAMPNVVALATEDAPARLLVMFGGMGAGAVVAGLSGTAMMPIWGWRSVLYLGGILPILLAIVLVKRLPESVRFLSVKGADPAQVSAILGRISPELARVTVTPPAQETRLAGLSVKHLFTEGRAVGTLLLWVPYFMNLLLLYFILSWQPALLRQAGMPVSAGIAAVMAFSVGNICGASAQGRLMTVFGATRVLLTEFCVAIALIAVLGYTLQFYELMLAVTFLLGVCIPGAQAGLNALAARFYPTPIRSTGVGWALGIGRVGSIIGPYIGGTMLAMSWTPQQIFLSGVIPAAIAAAAVLVSLAVPGRASAYRPRVAAAAAPAVH
jgi:AAHS family 4-hydroxybenzoate transporter-like MFS transporter